MLCIVGCKPVNPPSNETTSSIIDLCYASMGQSGEKLQKDFAGMGINVPKVEPYKDIENYKITTKSYEIAFSTLDDEVIGLNYVIFFKDTYVNGAAKYLEVSDFVFNYGWDKWFGNAHNYFESIEDRPSFVAEVKEYVPTWSGGSLGLSEKTEKSLDNDKSLFCTTSYWATDPLGINKDTGKGNSSVAESRVEVRMAFE